jgi:gluconokinase
MWFARHEPQLCARVRWWSGLKDHLLLALTGTLVTELSSASGTGLLDMSTRTWSTAAIELCGVDADRLPRKCSPRNYLCRFGRVASSSGAAVTV